jgi:hypothetical protein
MLSYAGELPPASLLAGGFPVCSVMLSGEFVTGLEGFAAG